MPLSSELISLMEQLSRAKEDLQIKEGELFALRLETASLHSTISSLNHQCQELSLAHNEQLAYIKQEHKREVDSMEGKLELQFNKMLDKVIQSHQKEIANMKDQRRRMMEELKVRNDEIVRLMGKIERIEVRYEQNEKVWQAANIELKCKVDELQQRIAASNINISKMYEQKIGKIREENKQQTSLLNQRLFQLRQILRQKEKMARQVIQLKQEQIGRLTRRGDCQTKRTHQQHNITQTTKYSQQKQDKTPLKQISLNTKANSLELPYLQKYIKP